MIYYEPLLVAKEKAKGRNRENRQVHKGGDCHRIGHRRELGEADYPPDEEFLSMLPKIGEASGVALGVDRLVMFLTGTDSIRDVVLFPQLKRT